jgi:hypothetical protein
MTRRAPRPRTRTDARALKAASVPFGPDASTAPVVVVADGVDEVDVGVEVGVDVEPPGAVVVGGRVTVGIGTDGNVVVTHPTMGRQMSAAAGGGLATVTAARSPAVKRENQARSRPRE